MSFKFKCPTCNSELHYDKVYEKEWVMCPNCSAFHPAPNGNHYCYSCSMRFKKWEMHDYIDSSGKRYKTYDPWNLPPNYEE